jgi:hypothetical protein
VAHQAGRSGAHGGPRRRPARRGDRVAQAQIEALPLVTGDVELAKYEVATLDVAT